ncbi:FHA domain-containing protein [Conchiformibius steedae DSM 2580]|uniref:FHA domain-containing protein n=1 Tax=Conchiformibius steedae DSM 2580 TaxID=1121352 RepID=A0AAE9HUB1_9NEIS|nr:FHA domain-containing protein [Conchiformibius steedae]QMT33099.1 FHA domain-containing protein [Conchiformibius steedae]URD67729.1 FHA domain-containing protein [Conchiformibius steedae DSM 2580]
MNKIKLFACWLLLLWVLPARADDYPDVRAAQQSVYRVWLGLPLPKEFTLQSGTQYRPALDNKGFAVAPFDGLQLQSKSSGKLREAGGSGLIFQYGAQPYLLLASGSAYSVSKQGHLLTNAAVAADASGTEVFFTDKAGMRYNGGDGKVRAFVVMAVSPKLSLLPADTVAADSRRDLAVLAVKDPRMLHAKAKPIALADPQFVERGTPVFAVGMEGVSDQLGAKRGAFDEQGYLNPSNETGLLERHVKNGAADAWEHSAAVQGSMRGGPLLNRCGQAVATAQIGKNQVAVANSEAAALLRKQQIPFEQATGRCGGAEAVAANWLDAMIAFVKTAADKPHTFIPLLIIGALVLVACVVAWKLLFWVLRRKRRSAARAPDMPQHQAVPPRPEPAQATRRAAAPSPKTHKVNPAAAGVPARLTVQTGAWQPLTVYPQQSLRVGRDTDCDAVIADGRVSSHHLDLYFDGNQLFVEDANSTNGTFINGKRTNGRTRLNRGDVLQLTSDADVAVFVYGDTAAAPVARLRPQTAGLPEVLLFAEQSVQVGRAAHNDLQLSDMQVSGTHALLRVEADGSLMLSDQGSTNGTFVDHVRIDSPVRLRVGQSIFFGSPDSAYVVAQPD